MTTSLMLVESSGWASILFTSKNVSWIFTRSYKVREQVTVEPHAWSGLWATSNRRRKWLFSSPHASRVTRKHQNTDLMSTDPAIGPGPQTPQRTTKKIPEDWNKNILTKTTPNSYIAVIHYHVLEMRLIDRNRMLICITSWIYPPFFVSPGVSPSRKTGAITIKWY